MKKLLPGGKRASLGYLFSQKGRMVGILSREKVRLASLYLDEPKNVAEKPPLHEENRLRANGLIKKKYHESMKADALLIRAKGDSKDAGGLPSPKTETHKRAMGSTEPMSRRSGGTWGKRVPMILSKIPTRRHKSKNLLELQKRV